MPSSTEDNGTITIRLFVKAHMITWKSPTPETPLIQNTSSIASIGAMPHAQGHDRGYD